MPLRRWGEYRHLAVRSQGAISNFFLFYPTLGHLWLRTQGCECILNPYLRHRHGWDVPEIRDLAHHTNSITFYHLLMSMFSHAPAITFLYREDKELLTR